MNRITPVCTLFALITPMLASAGLVPDIAAPDPDIGALGFGGYQSVSSIKPGTPKVIKLGMGTSASEDPLSITQNACNYEMVVYSWNMGTAPLSSSQASALSVQVNAEFPDGSKVSSEGKLCLKGDIKPGYGCYGTATVLLPSGTTKLDWTVDPGNQVLEWDENNNRYQVILEVPSPCVGQAKGEVALVQSGDDAAESRSRVRNRFAQGFIFDRNVRPRGTDATA